MGPEANTDTKKEHTVEWFLLGQRQSKNGANKNEEGVN